MYFIDDLNQFRMFLNNFIRNTSSETIETLSISALVRLLGPILSPATKKLVFEEIDVNTFPPLSSISFFNSFRKTVSNTPETTNFCPVNFWLKTP